MILQLKVTSKQGSGLGERAVARFDASGGTIGRGRSSDWVLPDTDAVLSRQHAEIAFTGGRFELIDLSSNGTFVNGRPVASMPGRRVVLAHADKIELGGYILAAEIEANRVEPDRPSVEAGPQSVLPEPAASAALDEIDALLGDLAGAPDRTADADRAQPPRTAPAWPAQTPIAIPDDWDPLADEDASDDNAANVAQPPPSARTPGRDTRAPAVPAPSLGRVGAARSPATPMPASRGPGTARSAVTSGQPTALPADEAQAAFWDALFGAPSPSADPQTMAQLGSALRLTLEHLMDLLAARRHVKTQFRLEQTQIAADANNPLKFMRGIDDLVRRVVVAGEPGYQPIGQAVDGAFKDIKAHEVATASAMQSALTAIVRQFAPDTLKQHLGANATATPGRSGTLAKAQYWDEFVANYGELADGAADQFDRVFQHEFARAYAAYVERGTDQA